MFENTNVENPKLDSSVNSIYPYYAGYNPKFVDSVLDTTLIQNDGIVLDPWNGSGTTTSQASKKGFNCYGIDINPVMIMLAKADLVPSSEKDSIIALTKNIINRFHKESYLNCIENEDPLLIWFQPRATGHLRLLQKIINDLLSLHSNENINEFVNNISSYSALIHTAVLVSIRNLTTVFKSSNPTWIKKPKSKFQRINPSANRIIKIFEQSIYDVTEKSHYDSSKFSNASVKLSVGSSSSTGIEDNKIDLIITSPPYCTRIDYAISTQIELAYLNFTHLMFNELRNHMIGSSTISKKSFHHNEYLGDKVEFFLDQLKKHPSKASSSYYYKTHRQYYSSVNQSLKHQQKVLRKNGGMVLVVQDSYYKEIHNDLQENIVELAESNGLTLKKRFDFPSSRTMANLHTSSKKYRNKKTVVESVLCFIK
ncbi:hypothetical protein BST97_11585 [Nonlabens spongiae]|uniref:site-specific DNA-methyltransferase (cytosine-N(4)-specific) n=1 Tax=Nonlabens spongiae TaxID=331648 RepID=A0A1W6MLY6_9FLAO|nr:DNA methyltransferase [Nonlabens spongiae]ARN78577.1 hypothetical protein BST97_11585 [Nonlabens spongiae]